MFEWFGGWIDQLNAFLQYAWDFVALGVYNFAKDGMVLLTKGALYSWFSIQIFALEVAYQAAQEIVASLNVTDLVRQQYNGINGDILSVFSFFGVPQALNIIFSALSTRFALRFVPFIGR